MLNEAVAGLNKAKKDCAGVYEILAFQLGFVVSFVVTLLVLINR